MINNINRLKQAINNSKIASSTKFSKIGNFNLNLNSNLYKFTTNSFCMKMNDINEMDLINFSNKSFKTNTPSK